MNDVRHLLCLLGVLACGLPILSSGGAIAQERLRLATTTSTANSGLLDVLLPPFEQKHAVKVDVIAVGTGKALRLAKSGDVDVVMVHAPEAELRFLREGYGLERRQFMYNDFVILGPPSDPAGIRGGWGPVEALRKIAGKQAVFVSRGDDSGTHKKERALWKAAGLTPGGAWYRAVGQGMGQTLNMANELEAYTLADRGTFLAYRGKIELGVLVEGGRLLFNPYGIIAVNPERHPHVKHALAMELIRFVSGREGQRIIGRFTRYGHRLFIPTIMPEEAG